MLTHPFSLRSGLNAGMHGKSIFAAPIVLQYILTRENMCALLHLHYVAGLTFALYKSGSKEFSTGVGSDDVKPTKSINKFSLKYSDFYTV